MLAHVLNVSTCYSTFQGTCPSGMHVVECTMERALAPGAPMAGVSRHPDCLCYSALRCVICVCEINPYWATSMWAIGHTPASPHNALSLSTIPTYTPNNQSINHVLKNYYTVSPPVPCWTTTACPFSLDCSTDAAATVLWTLLACMPLAYALIFAWHVRRAFLQMQGQPYISVKTANIRLWVVVRVWRALYKNGFQQLVSCR